MAKTVSRNNIVNNSQFSWKKRPSEIRGYHRTIYLTTDNRDYHRVDYNLKEKVIRLYIEVADEGGNSYYSVIKNGKITAEKSIVSGRSFGFAEKFRERADIFCSIPNNEVLKLINKNYNIEISPKKKNISSERKKMLDDTRRKYFKPEEKKIKGEAEKIGLSIAEIKFIDFVDIVVGVFLSGLAFYLFQFDFIAMGIVSAFYGISIGLVDMIFRSRPPFIIKMIFFILAGTFLYIFGYFSL